MREVVLLSVIPRIRKSAEILYYETSMYQVKIDTMHHCKISKSSIRPEILLIFQKFNKFNYNNKILKFFAFAVFNLDFDLAIYVAEAGLFRPSSTEFGS